MRYMYNSIIIQAEIPKIWKKSETKIALSTSQSILLFH